MLDIAKINKLKAIKPGRAAKDKLYEYAVDNGLQEGIKKTFHISKMIEMMERNDILINSTQVIDRKALLTKNTRDKIDGYQDEITKVVPEFVERLKSLEEAGASEEKIEEEKLLQQLAVKKNIPTASFIGKNPPYIVIPYWVYDYIIANQSTWYRKLPTQFKDLNTYDLALSLIYYIRKDGAVTIRESRFSGFHTFIKG